MTGTISFGQQLRRLREAAGWTQEELAERAGLTSDGIGALERGARRRPHPHTIRALADALGLDAGARAVLIGSVPGRGRAADDLAAVGRSGGQTAREVGLPASLTALVGREREVRETLALLGRPEVRLLTLTGPGGVGKTRLAIAAARASDDFPDGVIFVGLAQVRDPVGVSGAIAEALGARDDGVVTAVPRLAIALGTRRVLLLLDNFEQVTAAAGDVVALLAACPNLKALITSRAALRIGGEQEYRVPPLALPATDEADVAALLLSPAIRLFAERARGARPDFALTPANTATVAVICRRLDGLPLAIELAAARAGLLSPLTLLTRLTRGKPVLAEGPRDLPPRQRTLRDTIAWSHDLLGERERCLYRRLATFADGCTPEAAEAVCGGTTAGAMSAGEVWAGLVSLTDQSLLTPVTTAAPGAVDGGDAPRLTMLETIREDALERLIASGEAAEFRQRHAAYYLALLERAEPDLTGPQQGGWGAVVASSLLDERDNFRAALAWSLSSERATEAIGLAGLMWPIWMALGAIDEGRRGMVAALAVPGAVGERLDAARARALLGAGLLVGTQGDRAVALEYFADSAALYRALGDRAGIARAMLSLGFTATEHGDYAGGRAAHNESIALYRDLGDRRGTAYALAGLGYLTLYQGDPAAAQALHEEALGHYRAIGDQRGIAHALAGLGYVALTLEDFATARALHEQSLAQSRRLSDRGSEVHRLSALGTIALSTGDHARAAALLEEGLALARALGGSDLLGALLRDLALVALEGRDYQGAARLLGESLPLAGSWGEAEVAVTLECCARLAGALGQVGQAAQLYGTAETLRARIGAPPPPFEQRRWGPARDAVRAQLGEAAAVVAWCVGGARSGAEALSAAQAMLALAELDNSHRGREGSPWPPIPSSPTPPS